MTSILDNCVGAPRKDFAAGTILLSEGETSGRLYILAEGSVEVLRGDTQVERDVSQLMDLCRRVLGIRAPRQIFVIDRIPRNAAGKALRRELAAS